MGEVGIHIPGRHRVVVTRHSGVRLAEDADKVRDPLLVSLSGQQCHYHQLDAQKHEQVAPFGLDTEHGAGSAWSTQQRIGGRRKKKKKSRWSGATFPSVT